MKTTTFKNDWITTAALLLSIPTAYFILVNILNERGISGPFESIQPFLERTGISDGFGFNINLLIVFGPVLALLLTIFQVLKIEWRFTSDEFLLNFAVQKRWFPLLVVLFSIGLAAILVLYFLVENYRHGC